MNYSALLCFFTYTRKPPLNWRYINVQLQLQALPEFKMSQSGTGIL